MEEEEKRRIHERAMESRKDWLDKKREQEHLKKEQEEKEKDQKSQEEMEKKKESQEAYDKWKQDAKKRPKSVTNNYAYSQGMLKGYYNATTNPLPNFFNPLPWVPLHIPKSSNKEAKSPKSGSRGSSPKTNSRGASPKTRSGSGKKAEKVAKKQELLSPPMLYKERVSSEHVVAWGRPR